MSRTANDPARSDSDDDPDEDPQSGDVPGDGSNDEWKFGVDDVGPDGVVEDTHTPEQEPIEPESVSVEHAVFVVLGVLLTVGVLLVGF